MKNNILLALYGIIAWVCVMVLLGTCDNFRTEIIVKLIALAVLGLLVKPINKLCK